MLQTIYNNINCFSCIGVFDFECSVARDNNVRHDLSHCFFHPCSFDSAMTWFFIVGNFFIGPTSFVYFQRIFDRVKQHLKLKIYTKKKYFPLSLSFIIPTTTNFILKTQNIHTRTHKFKPPWHKLKKFMKKENTHNFFILSTH